MFALIMIITMPEDSGIMDFIKMNFIMSRDKSGGISDMIGTLFVMLILPMVIEKCRNAKINWNIFSFNRANTLTIEGKRTLKSTSWCFHHNNLFTNEFRAIWYHINHVGYGKDIWNIKAITDCGENKTDQYGERDTSMDEVMYIVNQNERFKLADGIFCSVYMSDNSEKSEKLIEIQGQVDTITVELYSYTKTVDELKMFIEEKRVYYMNELEKQRNNKKFIYTFEQDNSGDECVKKWNEIEFKSFRTFDNMFFPQKEELLRQLVFFRDNEASYNRHGDPYTLGICLYGPPGTGKTCIAKSIANMFQRHLVELPLDIIRTKSEFKKCFFESKYNQNNKNGSIDFDKKIILLEDIDCMSDIVFDREEKYNKTPDIVDSDIEDGSNTNDILATIAHAMTTQGDAVEGKKGGSKTKNLSGMFGKSNSTDELTLSFILNALDGIRETPGRIIIMTSNYVHKLDKALKRHGRIDICLELGHATMDTVQEFYHHHYQKDISLKLKRRLNIDKLTPAEMVNIRRSCSDGKSFLNALIAR